MKLNISKFTVYAGIHNKNNETSRMILNIRHVSNTVLETDLYHMTGFVPYWYSEDDDFLKSVISDLVAEDIIYEDDVYEDM